MLLSRHAHQFLFLEKAPNRRGRRMRNEDGGGGGTGNIARRGGVIEGGEGLEKGSVWWSSSKNRNKDLIPLISFKHVTYLFVSRLDTEVTELKEFAQSIVCPSEKVLDWVENGGWGMTPYDRHLQFCTNVQRVLKYMTCSCKYKHSSKTLTQRTYYVFTLVKGHTYITKFKAPILSL